MNLFNNPHKQYLDKGHVVLLDTMGSDQDIEYAARMSYADGTRTVLDTQKLIDFLMRHEHTSPFEMAEAKFQIRLPIFVMRQLVRHRTFSLNEVSLRYSKFPEDSIWQPAKDRMRTQSAQNKQCSSDTLIEHAEAAETVFEFIAGQTQDAYSTLVDELDLSREVARCVLPVAAYTEVVIKADLKNLMHFLRLRLHSHAQEEIRVLAQAMYDLLKETSKFNLTLDAFDRYHIGAVKLSSTELAIVRELVKDKTPAKPDNMSAREFQELKEKLWPTNTHD